MNILLLSTEDSLGAGKAAVRIRECLQLAGHETYLLVKHKTITGNPYIIGYSELVRPAVFSRIGKKVYSRLFEDDSVHFPTDSNFYFFGARKSELDITKLVALLPVKPDLIIATWISGFFNHEFLLQLKQLTGAVLLLYPLDMSLFTGGCHYAWGCNGYSGTCLACPAILNEKDKWWANHELDKKKKSFQQADTYWLAASAGLLEQLDKSSIASKRVLKPELLVPVNETVFNSAKRHIAKNYFRIDAGKKTIFFGSSFAEEKRKGVQYFIDILYQVRENCRHHQLQNDDLLVLIAGNNTDPSLLNKIPLKTLQLGYLDKDSDLSMAYQASDVFVCTSLQDGGPMMINESVMCGTPVVTFKVGVSQNLVKEDFSGYTAEVGDISKMTTGILNILTSAEEKSKQLSEQISEFAKRHTGYQAFSKCFAELIAPLSRLKANAGIV